VTTISYQQGGDGTAKAAKWNVVAHGMSDVLSACVNQEKILFAIWDEMTHELTMCLSGYHAPIIVPGVSFSTWETIRSGLPNGIAFARSISPVAIIESPDDKNNFRDCKIELISRQLSQLTPERLTKLQAHLAEHFGVAAEAVEAAANRHGQGRSERIMETPQP
jgi:hypothetical protein